VADGASGVQVIDVSAPSAPTLAATYDTRSYARDVQVVGSLAYVAGGYSGLQVLSLSTPAIDLTTASDTGSLGNDNLTDDTTPAFDVFGADTGEYVRIYRDGTPVSGEYETSPVTLDTQPYGTYDLTAATVDAAGNVSEMSDPLTV